MLYQLMMFYLETISYLLKVVSCVDKETAICRVGEENCYEGFLVVTSPKLCTPGFLWYHILIRAHTLCIVICSMCIRELSFNYQEKK